MTAGLETGNASEKGRDSRGWIVGDLVTWAIERDAALMGAPTPRQTTHVEVKWSDHPPGDCRAEMAGPDSFMTLGILVDGDMVTEFVSASGERTSVRQSRRGDYVIWHGPSFSHQWRTDTGATVVTVRWPTTDIEK
jgi:hypothetical protein